MRRLTYYVATTADGFIAAQDGSFDAFLQQGEHLADLIADFPETIPGHLREPLGVSADNRRFDAVLMGRATYDVGRQMDVTNPYPHLEQYLFSRSLDTSPDPAVQLVSTDALGFVHALKQQPGKDIWLCGGGQLATTLFEEIDELILKLNPVLLGAGIPLFAGRVSPTRMSLVDQRGYPNGFLRLHYRLR